MKRVAKIVVVDHEDNYLLLERNNHPTLANDPDIPGGIVERHESSIEGVVREVFEEIGVVISGSDISHVYTGSEYSNWGMDYSLYSVRLSERPELAISWEHAGYEWLSVEDFMLKVSAAKDNYMHMVHSEFGKYAKLGATAQG